MLCGILKIDFLCLNVTSGSRIWSNLYRAKPGWTFLKIPDLGPKIVFWSLKCRAQGAQTGNTWQSRNHFISRLSPWVCLIVSAMHSSLEMRRPDICQISWCKYQSLLQKSRISWDALQGRGKFSHFEMRRKCSILFNMKQEYQLKYQIFTYISRKFG